MAAVAVTGQRLVDQERLAKEMMVVPTQALAANRWRHLVVAARAVQASMLLTHLLALGVLGVPTARMTTPTGPPAESELDSGLAAVVGLQALKVPVAVLAQVLVAVTQRRQTRGQVAAVAAAPQQVRLAVQAGQVL